MKPATFTLLSLSACLAITGCATAIPERDAAMPVQSRFTVPETAPELVLPGPLPAPEVAAVASRYAGVKPGLAGTRSVPAEFLPLVFAAPAGRAFLAMPFPRILMAGEPAASCPALAAGTGASMTEALDRATTTCRTELGTRPGCGCRVLAADATATAPLAAFAYAEGVEVRAFRSGRLDPLRLVATEAPLPEGSPDGTADILIFAGTQPIWRLAKDQLQPLDGEGKPSGPALAVKREPLGLDRGRVRERVTAVGLTLLIGV